MMEKLVKLNLAKNKCLYKGTGKTCKFVETDNPEDKCILFENYLESEVDDCDTYTWYRLEECKACENDNECLPDNIEICPNLEY